MSDKQHQGDTKYKQWADGMHVMLEDLDGDYELALVENSLRDSVYFVEAHYFDLALCTMCLGIHRGSAGVWMASDKLLKTKLTRSQALYITTGDTNGK